MHIPAHSMLRTLLLATSLLCVGAQAELASRTTIVTYQVRKGSQNPVIIQPAPTTKAGCIASATAAGDAEAATRTTGANVFQCTEVTTFLQTYKVTVPVSRQVTLTWQLPAANGAVISGYRLSYGRSADAMPQTHQANGATTRSATITNLDPGTWYFTARTVSETGNESVNSNTVNKTVL